MKKGINFRDSSVLNFIFSLEMTLELAKISR